MRAREPAAGDPGPPRRPVPTLLALLGFVPLGLLLWWAIAGPRPEPPPLDWSTLGLDVEEREDPPAFPVLHDPEWVRSEMTGWQAELGGRLGEPTPLGAGHYAAVVRNGGDDALVPLPDLAGVVEWSVGGGDVRRCAFPEPVPIDRVEDAVGGDDPEVSLEVRALAGRCTDEGPLIAVPVVRRHVVPISFGQQLAGQQAESALIPHGTLLLEGDGTITATDAVDPDLGLPAYPWEVARGALVEAEPENPAAEAGSWADPVYPILVPEGDRLWWVMPLAPLDGADRLSGYLLMAADEVEAGTLNPVSRHWLPEPEVGPTTIIDRAERLLARLDGDLDPAVRPTLPSVDGDWHGRVSTAEEPLRYVLEASRDGELCLSDPDGTEVGCRQDGEISRR